MVVIFYAKNGTFKMDAAASISISATTVLDTAFASATAVTGIFKDLTAEATNAEVDIINLCGTTGDYQNAAMDEKPPGLVTISGTLVVPGDEVATTEALGSGTAAGGTHTTYRIGKASLTKIAFLVNIDNSSEEVNWAGTNMIVTKFGSPKLSGADGHYEMDFEAKCLPTDFYGPQFKD